MLYLSQAIGRPVLDAAGEPIGKVNDLIVALGPRYPAVTGLVVETDRRRIFLPWSHVARFDASGARLSTATIDITKFQQRDDEFLLREDLLDKQIVDIDGRKVVRVNDLRLDDVEGKLHLVAVDVGAAGLLRRLGHGGRLPDPGPEPQPARRPSATSTGRTSTRSRPASRRSSSASRTPA